MHHAFCARRSTRVRPSTKALSWALGVLTLAACGPKLAPAPRVPEPAHLTASQPPAEVRPLDAAPRRTSPNGKAQITLLARGENAFVGKLELAPFASVPEHQDPTEEYIHVLSGHAVMVMNGERYDIGPGTTIFMPPSATVSVQNGDEPLVAIQVFAGPEPAAKYESWNE